MKCAFALNVPIVDFMHLNVETLKRRNPHLFAPDAPAVEMQGGTLAAPPCVTARPYATIQTRWNERLMLCLAEGIDRPLARGEQHGDERREDAERIHYRHHPNDI